MTTDELVVSDVDEIDNNEDFDDSDYLDEGEYEAEEADQWWLHWTYDFAFDFENQTECLVISTNRLLGWENDKTDDS